MFLVPKTLINLLLLNPNNLTHWSRDCPICLLGGSVSSSAGHTASLEMTEGEAGGRRTFCAIGSSHRRDTGEGTKHLQEEALLHITAHSQLCEDMGSGSQGCDWLLVWTVSTNLYWVPTPRGIYPDQVSPILVTAIYQCFLLSIRHCIQSSQQCWGWCYPISQMRKGKRRMVMQITQGPKVSKKPSNTWSRTSSSTLLPLQKPTTLGFVTHSLLFFSFSIFIHLLSV